MQLTAHVAVGAAVGAATGNPVLGFFAGWISHHVMDAIPHFDVGSLGGSKDNIFKRKTLFWWVITDVLISLIVVILALHYFGLKSPLLWGAIGGCMPDIINESPFWSAKIQKYFPFNAYYKFHDKIVHFTVKNKKYFWFGILTQVIAITISIFYLIDFMHR